ncbi:hypothetical protein [Phocaeicola coprophilus]|uniref:hypothetical protein n=1 Tax=Phocaeicola coprophilus TaxID=387090 RepID=UPI0039F5D303
MNKKILISNLKSFIGRLKACYYILTKPKYYVFAFYNENKASAVYIKDPTDRIDRAIVDFLESEYYKQHVKS